MRIFARRIWDGARSGNKNKKYKEIERDFK